MLRLSKEHKSRKAGDKSAAIFINLVSLRGQPLVGFDGRTESRRREQRKIQRKLNKVSTAKIGYRKSSYVSSRAGLRAERFDQSLPDKRFTMVNRKMINQTPKNALLGESRGTLGRCDNVDKPVDQLSTRALYQLLSFYPDTSNGRVPRKDLDQVHAHSVWGTWQLRGDCVRSGRNIRREIGER